MGNIKLNYNGKTYNVDFERAKELGVIKEINSKPKSWDEYMNMVEQKPKEQFLASTIGSGLVEKLDTNLGWCVKYNRFDRADEAKAFLALGKLIQLRDAWWNGWVPCCGMRSFGITKYDNGHDLVIFKQDNSGPDNTLTFPTIEMREEFLTCFVDLIKDALILL